MIIKCLPINKSVCITSAFPWHLTMQHESDAGTKAVFLAFKQVSYCIPRDPECQCVIFPSTDLAIKRIRSLTFTPYTYLLFQRILKAIYSLHFYLSVRDCSYIMGRLQQQSLMWTLQSLWLFFCKGIQRLVPKPLTGGRTIPMPLNPATSERQLCAETQEPGQIMRKSARASWKRILNSGGRDITSRETSTLETWSKMCSPLS